MLDEAAAVGCRAGLRPQPHFESCEGTGDTQPSLCYDNRDGAQMYESEPKAIDPMPTSKVADDDENKTTHDERNKGEVQRKHEICE